MDASHKVFVDAGNSRFLIKNSSGKEMVRMGLLNATQYGISGSDAGGNLLFKLGLQKPLFCISLTTSESP